MGDISKRYKAIATKVNRDKLYPLADAMKIVKENATAKFNESIDVAINLGIESFNFLLKTLGGFRTDPSLRNGLLVFGVMAVCTFWLWRLSPFFARLITRGQDATLDCGSLALSDLYTFAFLLVGLYFAVYSFGPSLTWLHYSVSQGSSDAALSQQQQANFYTLFKYLVKLFLGLALILNGRKFANKLIKRHNATA